MNIAVTGASGFIGSNLMPFLSAKGHTVSRILRSNPEGGKRDISWQPENGSWDTAYPDGLDGVVHLAGESIATEKWTEEKKNRIRDSRIRGTQLLCETISKLVNPPDVLVCASAIGFYGDRGEETLNEESPKGNGFLSDVCQGWEEATKIADQKGIRVVNLRFGMVLSAKGGALAKMLTPFKMGTGGRLGSGDQYMSWAAIDDVVGTIHHAIITDTLRGPVNVVAPQSVTNKVFTKTLGKVLKRPTMLPLPAFAARFIFGEMADELFLASVRAQPVKLINSGYQFLYPDLEGALRHLLEL